MPPRLQEGAVSVDFLSYRPVLQTPCCRTSWLNGGGERGVENANQARKAPAPCRVMRAESRGWHRPTLETCLASLYFGLRA